MTAHKRDGFIRRHRALSITAIIVAIFAFIMEVGTGVDTNTWTQLPDGCFMHVTQDKNVWLTPGHDGPIVRTELCQK